MYPNKNVPRDNLVHHKLNNNSPCRRLTRVTRKLNEQKGKGQLELKRDKNTIKQIKLVNTVNITKKHHDIQASHDEKQKNLSEGTQEDDFEEKIVSLKLQSMRKYIKPLSILTEKTLEEISKNNNRNLLSALEKLNTYKSIIDGTPFSPPENMSKNEFLQQMENTLSNLTSTLKSKYPEEFIDDQPVLFRSHFQNNLEKIGLEIVLQRLNIVDYLPVFTSNGVTDCEDLKLLTEENLKELGLPIGIRNRITNYFRASPLQINKNIAKTFTIEEYQRTVCDQLWESFICPITHDLMVDPVIAADGHTYDREAICKWFISNNTSPLTGATLPHTSLIPNHNLRSQIRQFYSSISTEN